MKKRIRSLLLALALVLTGVPMAFATESGFADGNVSEISTDGPVQLPSSNIAEDPTVETDAQQPVEAGEPKLVQNGEDRFSTQLAESEPKADEVVTFIVVMQKSPLLVAGFTKDDIATRAPKAVAYEAALRLELNALKANLTQKFRNDAQFELGYTYTIATTGVAVKTEYGNKEALEALPGVDHVYVAPTFSLPEEESTLTSDGELQPMTSNATTMIGADQLNAPGFTGKGMKVAILDTGITIDHLTYGYHEDAPVLNDVSVRFEAGKSYAIVGTSGSGKSTLVNLLMGSSNDYQGSIRFDQRELRSIATESLYGLVSVVQQNVFIFDDTIRNNITMFRHFDEKLVQQATEKAGLTPLLAERGEDYICGENGSGLSGGERQRISIARCLLRQTPVLLIDEATAALDAATAYSVSAAILAIEGLTRIVVTHRLEEPLLRKYDEILVLKNGEICERGSFDALMARREQFYSLFNVANG